MKGEELKFIIGNSGKTIREIVDNSGIPQRTLYHLFDRKKEIERHYLMKLVADGLELPNVANKKSGSSGVPVYDVDFTAGDIALFSDEPQREIGRIDLNGFRKCSAFVTVKGDSMYPKFIAGDLIGIEPMKDFSIIEYGQTFGVETKNGQRMIKVVRKGEDDQRLILRSINKEFDDIHIHKKEIDKLYKVHGPVRDQWQ